MGKDLPSDEEYLALLYESTKDDSYITSMRTACQEAFEVNEQFGILVSAGVYEPTQLSEYSTLSRETFSLDLAFRGRFIRTLQDMAFNVLGDDRRRVEGIPVGLLPTGELNACAIATPRGGAVILLDHGVIAQLAYLCRTALAFITWRSDQPFCRDSSQSAYAEALLGLARFTMTGDFIELTRHKQTLRFPSINDYDDTTTTFCVLMELFILLHEYGHVVRGHLSPGRVRPAFGGRFPGVEEYTKLHMEEFEADEYAVSQLLRAGEAAQVKLAGYVPAT